MKKGFTLIELLAVIVILAIIALIATPIILGIIKDSKEESNKRSVEAYAKALKNSIAKYQLSGKKLEVGELATTDGRNFSNVDDFRVDYDGNVVCEKIVIYEDGNIYLANCKVNGKNIEYTYGIKPIQEPVSFAADSWETIADNVRIGNLSKYNVGDTKEVSLTGFTNTNSKEKTTFTVRIANISSDDPVCKSDNYSKSACGFVVEFVDMIEKHNMNSNNTNVGGWRDSEMRLYINTTIYNALSKDLKKEILLTKIVSGHGSTSGEENFVTEDKLYLLSTKEVWGKEGTSNIINNDTAELETRQLDYYKDIAKVTTDDYDYLGAKKMYNEGASFWWLRSAHYSGSNIFYYVDFNGNWQDANAQEIYSVAPAFRIG